MTSTGEQIPWTQEDTPLYEAVVDAESFDPTSDVEPTPSVEELLARYPAAEQDEPAEEKEQTSGA